MKNDFILNESVTKIKNEIIKERYREVIICFNSGCYNATIVSLYTTMIYDMVLKLEKLAKIYKMSNAEELIKSIIEKTQSKSPDSSWEEEIICKFNSEFNIISKTEKDELLEFRKQRHYSAHPVLYEDVRDDTIIIKDITKETALDSIRKVFDYILSKDAIIGTNKLLENIVTDADDFIMRNSMSNFGNYIKTRYLNLLTDNVVINLFLFLVKLTFSDNSEKANQYRTQNAIFLEWMYNEYKSIILNDDRIKNIADKIKIENVLNESTEKSINALNIYCRLFCICTDFFKYIGEANQQFYVSKLDSLFITECYKFEKYKYKKSLNYNYYLYQIKFDLYYLAFKKVFLCEKIDLIGQYKNISSNIRWESENWDDGTQLILKIEFNDWYNLLNLFSSTSPALYSDFKDFLLTEISSLNSFDSVKYYAITLLENLNSYFNKSELIKFKELAQNNSQYSNNFEYDRIMKYIDEKISEKNE